jgi:hypothetical protein
MQTIGGYLIVAHETHNGWNAHSVTHAFTDLECKRRCLHQCLPARHASAMQGGHHRTVTLNPHTHRHQVNKPIDIVVIRQAEPLRQPLHRQ